MASAAKAAVEAVQDGVHKLGLKESKKKDAKAPPSAKELFRAAMTNVLERRLFFIPSFKIYGSVAGFYDFGPPGCAIKQNVTQLWRQHFILEESMLEVECPAVTPEAVLKASGHVDRFTDFMVTDMKTGECHRADHLLKAALEALLEDPKAGLTPEKKTEAEDVLARIDELDSIGLGTALTRYGVKTPDTKNDISAPFPFNLMFRTSIGPKGDAVGYLRPETAQGIFVNFKDLLYYNGGKLPFAAAQIGQSYRNEISPRAGLLRVREFTQAEIEHFVNPDDKDHPKFESIQQLKPLLFSQELQTNETKQPEAMSLGDAVTNKIIANQTLAYFIGRTYLFLVGIGISPKRLRFRQHLPNEMAHYAADCWDAEVECSYGWVECVGLADRSAYDLRAHSDASNQALEAYEKFPEPRFAQVLVAKPEKAKIGKLYKKEGKPLLEKLDNLSQEDAACMKKSFGEGKPATVSAGGRDFEVTPDLLDIQEKEEKLNGRKFTPSVIEPSFGIGRIIYCMFEHAYYTRQNNEDKSVFRFKAAVAPLKAAVFPLVQQPEMNSTARSISAALTRAGLANTVDTTGTTIGKRYARTDELGVPYDITVDRASIDGDGSVTLRERDSTSQVRVHKEKVAAVVQQLVSGELTWQNVLDTFPAQQPAAEEEA
ncbi:hypothetical protein WJX75_005632 [Coccomyxa subellipsoidea]|uniref:glycine--tRNA ligase n=1 Tax=Coccomyxa subellipsoidea TaxID=248742 RepID=A0ABR2YD14_9CHLO